MLGFRMGKKCFSEEQAVSGWRQAVSDASGADVIRKPGNSDQAFE
jgi:hypothetical protein